MAIHLNLNEVISIFNEMSSLNDIQRNILADILRDRNESETLDLCIHLLEEGWDEVLFPLYIQIRYNEIKIIDLKNCELVLYRLMQFIDANNRWAIKLMYELYQKSLSFSKLVRSKLKYTDGIIE